MWIEIAGWAGMGMMLINYYLASHQYLDDHHYPYHGLNFLGAIGVMMNAFAKGVLAVGFLEVVWGCIALLGIYNVYRHARSTA